MPCGLFFGKPTDQDDFEYSNFFFQGIASECRDKVFCLVNKFCDQALAAYKPWKICLFITEENKNGVSRFGHPCNFFLKIYS